MQTNIEQLTEHVTLEWLYEGRVAVLTVRNTARHDVDAWADRNDQLVDTWPAGKPFLVLHDVQMAILSPYARARAQKTTEHTRTRNIEGRYAVVVSSNVFGQTIAMFVNIDLRRRGAAHLEGRCFTHRERALSWMVELL